MTARALTFLSPFALGVFASSGGLFGWAAGAPKRRAGESAAVIRQAAEPSGPPTHPADIERFRRLLLPFQDDAYGFALHLCRDPSTAEDLTQEAYLKAFRGFSGYRGGEPKAWLLAIVRSCFLDWARGRKAWTAMVDPHAETEAAEQAPAEDPTVEDLMVREAGMGDLRRAIDGLPEPFKETLVLRELQEMNYRQIAEITGAPIGTVMSRLARARRMLIAALRPEGALA
ncbi:MAG TPA: sigma-70 family RNA polymerase sigma factor [Caulobacteraceae bacterium]